MHSVVVVTWRYKGGLESTMEQKRIVIDQGSRYSLLIPSFEPIHTELPWSNGNVAKEARGKGTKVDSDYREKRKTKREKDRERRKEIK